MWNSYMEQRVQREDKNFLKLIMKDFCVSTSMFNP